MYRHFGGRTTPGSFTPTEIWQTGLNHFCFMQYMNWKQLWSAFHSAEIVTPLIKFQNIRLIVNFDKVSMVRGSYFHAGNHFVTAGVDVSFKQ